MSFPNRQQLPLSEAPLYAENQDGQTMIIKAYNTSLYAEYQGGQPLVASQDAREPPSPNDPTRFIISSRQQFREVGNTSRVKVAGRRPPSSNSLPVVNDDGEWNEANSRPPSHSRFIRAPNSPYQNVDSYDESVARPPEPTYDRPPSGNPPSAVNGNGGWDLDGANHRPPTPSPFMRVPNSPYQVVDPFDEKVNLPPEHTSIRPSLQSDNHDNSEWEQADRRPPSHSTFMRVSNSPYPQDNPLRVSNPPYPQHNPLPGVNGNRLSSNNPYDDELPSYNESVGYPFKIIRFCYACISEENIRAALTIKVSTAKQSVGEREAFIVPETENIFDAIIRMRSNLSDFIILIDSNGLLSGVLTTKDVETRVIAPKIDMVNTPVSKVMTKNPIFVTSDAIVLEAMLKMAQGGVTLLPLIENGKVSGFFQLFLCSDHSKMEMDATNTNKFKETAMKAIAQWCLDLDAHIRGSIDG